MSSELELRALVAEMRLELSAAKEEIALLSKGFADMSDAAVATEKDLATLAAMFARCAPR